MSGPLVLLALGAAAFWLGAVAFTVRTLTHPPRRTYAWAVARGRPGDPGELPPRHGAPRTFERWTLDDPRSPLPVWDIPGDAAAQRADHDGPPPPIVVLLHGWGESRVLALARLPALLPCAGRIIIPDLPGHGEAPASCALGTREVRLVLALLDRVREPGVPIILFGSSLGAGIAIAAAACADPPARDIAGVIAEAPYRMPWTPARNVLRQARLPYRLSLMPAMWCLGLRLGVGPRWTRAFPPARRTPGRPAPRPVPPFDRAALAARLACPLLVLHGSEDDVCPLGDARAIAAAAGPRATLHVVPGAGHLNLWTDPRFAPACTRAVRTFMDSLRADATTDPAAT